MSVADLQLTRVPSMKVGMLIRRPPGEVFQAFVDPAVTTKFWFTKSSGKLVPGATVKWEWEMYGISTMVTVREVEKDSRLLLEWDHGGKPTTIDMRFVPWAGDTTYVQITETGLSGSADEIVSYLADSTGGFSMVLCALKALLEHGVALTVVLDHVPTGLQL